MHHIPSDNVINADWKIDAVSCELHQMKGPTIPEVVYVEGVVDLSAPSQGLSISIPWACAGEREGDGSYHFNRPVFDAFSSHRGSSQSCEYPPDVLARLILSANPEIVENLRQEVDRAAGEVVKQVWVNNKAV